MALIFVARCWDSKRLLEGPWGSPLPKTVAIGARDHPAAATPYRNTFWPVEGLILHIEVCYFTLICTEPLPWPKVPRPKGDHFEVKGQQARSKLGWVTASRQHT